MAKDFKGINNPSISTGYVSVPEETATPAVPQGYKLVPEDTKLAEEAKTARVQMLIKPTVKAKAQDKARAMGTSLNDYIHQLIEADLDK